MCRAIAQLVSAAHPHQREANPSITRTASTATAIRLTRPKVAMCRFPEKTAEPHVART
jgi:hypothetical protein